MIADPAFASTLAGLPGDAQKTLLQHGAQATLLEDIAVINFTYGGVALTISLVLVLAVVFSQRLQKQKRKSTAEEVKRATGLFHLSESRILESEPSLSPCTSFDIPKAQTEPLPPEKYYVTLRWQALRAKTSWKDFPWAGASRETTLATWANAVGCPKLPASMTEALLLIETSLLFTRHRGTLSDSHLPPLNAYARYSATSGTAPLLHNPAWFPLAVDLALSGDEMIPESMFPGLVSTHALAKRHFEYWAEIPSTAPGLPNHTSPHSPVVGAWQLESGKIGLPLNKKTTKLVYSEDGWMVASLRWARWPYFRMDYSGRYYVKNGVMHHLCHYNSPGAGLESVEPVQGPGNYGADRQRDMFLSEDGSILTLRPPTFGGQNLTWRRVDEFTQ